MKNKSDPEDRLRFRRPRAGDKAPRRGRSRPLGEHLDPKGAAVPGFGAAGETRGLRHD